MRALLARNECAGSCSPDRASANRRQAIERQIDALIDQLDAMDGDADHEDDGTAEPSLGWSLTQAHDMGDDREGTSPEWRGPVLHRRRAR